MKKRIKRGVFAALRGAGALKAVKNSGWRSKRLAILCYHSLSQEDEYLWAPHFMLSPRHLEERLNFLREEDYRVLPLGEALTRLYAGTLPPRSVALTFDDGTYDFHSLVRPLLDKYGMAATVYLSTFYCFYPRPVFRMFCSYLLWKGRGNYDGGELAGAGSGFDLSNERGRESAMATVTEYAKSRKMTLPERDEMAKQLAGRLGLDYEAILRKRILQLMTPSEVAELSKAGQDIQLHTHRHRTPDDETLFRREIRENRERIAGITGHDPVHFCYPSGVYEKRFLPWLTAERVASATTCVSGLCGPHSHPLLLPRIVDTMNLSMDEFAAWVAGAGAPGRI